MLSSEDMNPGPYSRSLTVHSDERYGDAHARENHEEQPLKHPRSLPSQECGHRASLLETTLRPKASHGLYKNKTSGMHGSHERAR